MKTNLKIKMKLFKSTALVLLLLTTILISGCGSSTSNESMDQFATCLTENGAEMYGAYWCGHCQDQKKMFGSSFAKINYIECTIDEQKCDDEGIEGYPTWKFADGTALGGSQSFTTLALKTGCPLP